MSINAGINNNKNLNFGYIFYPKLYVIFSKDLINIKLIIVQTFFYYKLFCPTKSYNPRIAIKKVFVLHAAILNSKFVREYSEYNGVYFIRPF